MPVRRRLRVRLVIATAAFVVVQSTAWFGQPPAIAAGSSPFTDIAGRSFEADVEWLSAENITYGCAPTLYCPDRSVTRAEMASFLVRMFDLADGAEIDAFTDDERSSHEANINRLAHAGITQGCASTLFCPDDPVSRAEMASLIARAVPLTDGAGDNYFRDDSETSHEANIDRLAAAGITNGCAQWHYCPEANVTRGQMAAFLHRVIEPIPVLPHPAPGPTSLFVAISGDDSHNTCLSAADPCRTITWALSKAMDGDTVEVGPGTFTDHEMVIRSDITIRGAVNLGTVLGPSAPIFGSIFSVQSDATVELDRLVVRGYRAESSPIKNFGSLRIVNSLLTDNKITHLGGAIWSRGFLRIENSTLSDNQGGFWGGAIASAGRTEIVGSLLVGNRAELTEPEADGLGGAIHASGYLSVTNSTIVGNYAREQGGGIHAIYGSEVWIINSTITGNTAGNAFGGIGFEGLNIRNSIVAGNMAPFEPEATGVESTVASIIGIPAGMTLADILDPAGLADNGGPTKTIALVDAADNPAIDTGNNTVCAAAPVSGVDQRGLPRAAPCDIGAYEVQP